MHFHLPDPASPSGASIARRLHDEPLIWLTTVDAKECHSRFLSGFCGMKRHPHCLSTAERMRSAWHIFSRTPTSRCIWKQVAQERSLSSQGRRRFVRMIPPQTRFLPILTLKKPGMRCQHSKGCSEQKKNPPGKRVDEEPMVRFELTTSSLQNCCSTPELHRLTR